MKKLFVLLSTTLVCLPLLAQTKLLGPSTIFRYRINPDSGVRVMQINPPEPSSEKYFPYLYCETYSTSRGKTDHLAPLLLLEGELGYHQCWMTAYVDLKPGSYSYVYTFFTVYSGGYKLGNIGDKIYFDPWHASTKNQDQGANYLLSASNNSSSLKLKKYDVDNCTDFKCNDDLNPYF